MKVININSFDGAMPFLFLPSSSYTCMNTEHELFEIMLLNNYVNNLDIRELYTVEVFLWYLVTKFRCGNKSREVTITKAP